MDSSVQNKLIFSKKLEDLGFSLNDAPHAPIAPEWESFPIVKAIRKVERETGIKYCSVQIQMVISSESITCWPDKPTTPA